MQYFPLQHFRLAAALVAFACLSCQEARAASQQPVVTVTATRSYQMISDALASVTVITREDIERSQAPDLLALMRMQAGIDVSRTGGIGQSTGLFVRGTASNQQLVLIDGVRVASANSGLFDFAHLPLDQIERIEIVRGPRATYWGSDAIGGVIQIFTREPRKLAVRARAGRWDTLGGSVGYGARDERGGFGATLGSERAGGYSATTPDNFSYDPDDDAYINRNLALQGDLALGRHLLSGAAIATRADVEFDQGTTDARNHSLGLTLSGLLTQRWNHALTAASARESLSTPAFFALFQSRRESLDWVNELQLDRKSRLGFGLNYLHEDGESRDTFAGVPQYAESRDNHAAFLSWRRSGDRFDAELAGRHDSNSVFGGETTFQAAGGFRSRDEATRVFVSYGEGFRAPTLNELYSPGFGGLFAGNPELDPERSSSVELGFEHELAAAHRFSARLYRTRVRDLVDFSGGETFQARNVKRASIDGLELTYAWQGEAWGFDANTTLQDAEDETADTDLLRRPSRKLAAVLERRFESGLELALEGYYASRRRDFAGDLGSYALAKLRASYPFANGWRAGAVLDNAFDREYELVSGYATPRRSLLFTVGYDTPD